MTLQEHTPEPLHPYLYAVEAHQMLGWLHSVITGGQLVDVAVWNQAVLALQNTDADTRPHDQSATVTAE